jgi:hypothetical protein
MDISPVFVCSLNNFLLHFLHERCIPYDKPNLAFIICSFVEGKENHPFLTDGFSSQVFYYGF